MALETGTFLFPDGAKYEGQYVKGENGPIRQGKGKVIDGPEVYEGEFQGDKFHGKGTYTFATGARYEGEFQNNVFEGQGEYRWPDGASYVGTWKQGRMHGQGLYTDPEGVKWKGSFTNGVYNNSRTFITLR